MKITFKNKYMIFSGLHKLTPGEITTLVRKDRKLNLIDQDLIGSSPDLTPHQGDLLVSGFKGKNGEMPLDQLVLLLAEIKLIKTLPRIEYDGWYIQCPEPSDLLKQVNAKRKALKAENLIDQEKRDEETLLQVPEKISVKLSVMIEKKFLDLSCNTRFWMFNNRYGFWMMHQKKEGQTALVEDTKEIFYPLSDSKVLIKDESTIFIHIKPTKMATKKKAAAKKPATKKATTPAKKEGPTKKELVAKYLKAGKKPAEIVELMKKNDKTETTIGSVRCFIQAIKNGE